MENKQNRYAVKKLAEPYFKLQCRSLYKPIVLYNELFIFKINSHIMKECLWLK